MRVFITGVAGFIGSELAKSLLQNPDVMVTGIDSVNDYYSVDLKHARICELSKFAGFTFHREDIRDHSALLELMKHERYDVVLHFAGEVGVRNSLSRPFDYHSSNLDGFLSVLEACRHAGVERIIYASSSSIYGDRPGDCSGHLNVKSLYAATKLACESYAQSYVSQYGMKCTGLRLFTVYGPWGRPDMAIYRFTDSIVRGEPITLYDNGDLQRDFTYIGDVVKVVSALINATPEGTLGGHAILDVGGGEPRRVSECVGLIESHLGITADIRYQSKPSADAISTRAERHVLNDLVGAQPFTSLEAGVSAFIEWYKGTSKEQLLWCQ